jgi:hypothetical protein
MDINSIGEALGMEETVLPLQIGQTIIESTHRFKTG